MATHRRTRKPSELKPLEVTLSKVLDAAYMQRLGSVARLRRQWHDIVGTMLAERSEPVAIEPQADGSLGLLIAVHHSSTAYQIRMLHEEIRKACFKRCKLQGLSKVWTRVQAGAGIRHERSQRVLQEVGCRELRLLAQSLQVVEDKPLRKMMFDAGKAQLQYLGIKQR